MFELSNWERSPWSIFDELDSLQRDVSRALGAIDTPALDSRKSTFPPMNVWSSKDGLVLDVELPGVDPKDVEINVLGHELSLSGEKSAVVTGEGETLHRNERRSGRFKRVLTLPYRADANGVKAHFNKGVLRVEVPRAEEEKPKRIAVEAA